MFRSAINMLLFSTLIGLCTYDYETSEYEILIEGLTISPVTPLTFAHVLQLEREALQGLKNPNRLIKENERASLLYEKADSIKAYLSLSLSLLITAEGNGDVESIVKYKHHVANANFLLGFPDKALSIWLDLCSACSVLKCKNMMPAILSGIASVYFLKNKSDLAIKFYKEAIETFNKELNGSNSICGLYFKLSEAYYYNGNYVNALFFLEKALNELPPENINSPIFTLNELGDIYVSLKDCNRAKNSYNKAIEFCLLTNNPSLANTHALVSTIDMALKEKKIGDLKSVQQKLKLSMIAKDSLRSRTKKIKIYSKTIKHRLLKCPITISRQLRKIMLYRLFYSLMMGTSFFLVVILVLLNERKYLNLKNTKIDLQMTALRMQLNPHFVFSCLTSINRFVLIASARNASNYLGKFAKLMRLILDNSKAAFIPLAQEISSLTLYLELEKLRFNYTFSYKITIAYGIDADLLKIIPMIIQPYLENSVWHGMQGKLDSGIITIKFEKNGLNYIECIIEDNGIGRKRSSEIAKISSTFKSNKVKGMRLNEDRFKLLVDLGFKKTSQKVFDLEDSYGVSLGTRVVLNIPCLSRLQMRSKFHIL
jgi:tetratricopeptide (TPR) repeat protein